MKVAKRADLTSSHYKTKICNYVWRWMLTSLIVVIISQHIHTANHYVIQVKLIIYQLYFNEKETHQSFPSIILRLKLRSKFKFYAEIRVGGLTWHTIKS